MQDQPVKSVQPQLEDQTWCSFGQQRLLLRKHACPLQLTHAACTWADTGAALQAQRPDTFGMCLLSLMTWCVCDSIWQQCSHCIADIVLGPIRRRRVVLSASIVRVLSTHFVGADLRRV